LLCLLSFDEDEEELDEGEELLPDDERLLERLSSSEELD